MLDINVATVKHARVVTMVGEVDGGTAPEAQEQILALVEPDSKVILDMSGVTYMSSAGLRMLLLAYRAIGGEGGRIALVGLSTDLRDTMSMTGFLDYFECCDTLEAGLSTLA